MTEQTEHRVWTEPCPRRVRAVLDGVTIADSTGVLYLYETGLLPTYYFPRADVRFDLLKPTDHHTTCPFKGEASYWSIQTERRTVDNAVWGYPEPLPHAPDIAGYVAFYWDRLDAWY